MIDPTVELDGASRGTLGRQARGKETRRNLIRTAARLWSDRGFDAVTVEEICSEAGVGRTTFYLHFENKERLLASLAGATATGVAADLEQAGASASLDERLDVLIRGISRRMQEVPKSLAQLVINSQRLGLMKAGPDDIAAAIAGEIGREVDYEPVEAGGAARAAASIAELL